MRAELLAALAFFLGLTAGAAVTYFSRPTPDAYKLYRQISVDHHMRTDRNLPEGSVLFFGSSTIAGLNFSEMACAMANFGLGGETTAELLQRLSRYESIDRASLLVMHTGLASILTGMDQSLEHEIAAIFDTLDQMTPVLLIPLQPASPKASGKAQDVRNRIDQINTRYQQFCDRTEHCLWADFSWPIRQDYFEPDAIHLNPAGYQFLKSQIKNQIAPFCVETK